MKKVISLMLALVLALSLTACGGKAGPEGVVGRFLQGLAGAGRGGHCPVL